MRKSIGETEVCLLKHNSDFLKKYDTKVLHIFYFLKLQELKRFPSLRADIADAANQALERFRDESKKTVFRMVDMESSYLTVDFFRKLPQEAEKTDKQNASAITADRYAEGPLRRISSNVFSYVNMVSETLKNTIPKAVVYCQVREAKQSLLDHFYTQLGKREVSLGYYLIYLSSNSTLFFLFL